MGSTGLLFCFVLPLPFMGAGDCEVFKPAPGMSMSFIVLEFDEADSVKQWWPTNAQQECGEEVPVPRTGIWCYQERRR